MKKLAVAAVLFIILLIVMWRSMQDGDQPAAAPAQPEKVASIAPSVKRSKPIEAPIDPKMDQGDAPKPTDGKPEKLDHMSDEFFYKFTERVPKVLTANAATCYETMQGSLHRNAKLVLDFKVIIKNGQVTVHNVKVKHSDDPKQKTNSLDNPALESCFIQQVARAGWHDDTLPDYEWPDELVLRPERGMKGFQKSNLDYVGAEAPKRDPKAHLAIKPPPRPEPEPKQEPKKD